MEHEWWCPENDDCACGPDDVEGAKAIMRSFRRTVPAEDALKRVRPVGSDRPFGDTGSKPSGGES
jgi:hypothetical protein